MIAINACCSNLSDPSNVNSVFVTYRFKVVLFGATHFLLFNSTEASSPKITYSAIIVDSLETNRVPEFQSWAINNFGQEWRKSKTEACRGVCYWKYVHDTKNLSRVLNMSK